MKKKPKVIVVGPLPPPVGGVENFTVALLASDIPKRFNVFHCNITKGRPKQTQGKFDFGNLKWAIRHFNQLRGDIKRFKPDAVYLPISATKSGFLRDSIFIRIIKRAGVTSIGHVHGSDFEVLYERASNRLKKYIIHSINMLDCMLPLGSAWTSFFNSIGVTSSIIPVPSTLREEVYDAGMNFIRQPKLDGSINVLFLGQVGKRKGVFDILEAMPNIHAKNSSIKFNFIGPDEYHGEWEQIMSIFNGSGMEKYTQFHGPKQGDDILLFYEQADIFLMPSYLEGLPAVLFEASCYGLPIITTPVGAIPDLITDGENGFLIKPGEVRAIEERILSLASDAELRNKMGEAARVKVSDFHPSKIFGRVGDAIEIALEKARTGGLSTQ